MDHLENGKNAMNDEFDELTKSMARSATRRAALKKFGVGLAGIALAALGLANKGHAQTGCLPSRYACTQDSDCCSGHCKSEWISGFGNKGRYKVWVCV
jgi:hypothetical protein